MTRAAIIGMAFVILALAGCQDIREIRPLRNKVDNHSDEIAYLKKRVTALEEAFIQLNERMSNLGSKESAPTQSREIKTPVKTGKLTRETFSERLPGSTLAEVMTILGKPDKVSDEDGDQTWTYGQVNLATESGGNEKSSAVVYFEKGSVSRADLTADTAKQAPAASP